MSKYLELFKGSFDDSIIEKMKPENYPYVAYSAAENRVVYGELPLAIEGPADNEIWYTTTDGNKYDLATIILGLTSMGVTYNGPNVVSNEYDTDK